METITIYVDKVGMIKDEIRKALGNQMRADAYKGNNIKYHINLYRDKRIDKQTILEYLVCTFIPAVKNKIQEENLQDAWEKSSALIGAEGRIFLITKNFAVIEQPEVAAIGIHHGFALGYVTAIKGCWPPQEILNKAMHALIRNSQGCIGPVVEKMI